MSKHKVPMRRCVGCMTSFPKGEVVRFAASDGKLLIDAKGKSNGRGAYLCRSLDCFDMAVKKKRLSYALGVSMTQEEIDFLREDFSKIISDTEVSE